METKVYAAIATVAGSLAKEGISKARNNTQQGYKFRGIDDVYNALAPFLASAKLCILPRMLTRSETERKSAKGGALFVVVVDAEFDFVSAEDGSKHTVRTFGEAMDSADKATNKAMSAAYKYACMQAFCIPTEGDNDADATTYEVAPRNGDGEREGIPEKKLADLLAHLEESTTLEDLRDRTKNAYAIARAGADVDAHEAIKAKSIEVAALPRFKAAA